MEVCLEDAAANAINDEEADHVAANAPVMGSMQQDSL
jgi:hypothetical protein